MPNTIKGYYMNDGTEMDNIFVCDYVQIKLLGNHATSNNSNILISKESFELVIQFNWYLGKDGYPVTYGTDDRKIRYGKGLKLHRMLFPNIQSGYVVDHINHDRLDNRMSNLRVCTQKENNYNKSKLKGFAYKGVVKNKNGLFSAKISKDGKTHQINNIATEKEAAQIYDLMAEELFGEYAGKNFN